jgi:hypothetical protein
LITTLSGEPKVAVEKDVDSDNGLDNAVLRQSNTDTMTDVCLASGSQQSSRRCPCLEWPGPFLPKIISVQKDTSSDVGLFGWAQDRYRREVQLGDVKQTFVARTATT